MNSTITDAEQIAEKINGYIQGCTTGDGTHLKGAFHSDARMFGAVGADRYDVPIFGGMDAAVADQPVGEYDTRVLSIDITGEVPSTAVRESVLRIAWAEAQRIRPDVEIHDRLTLRAAERAA